MLPCENSRCVNYLTVDEIVSELVKRKAFKGVVLKTDDNNIFSASHGGLDKDEIVVALEKAIQWVKVHA